MSDSSHPLLLKESMPILDLLPSYLGHVDPLDARLQFNAKGITPICEVPPDKIEIRCWEEKHWGNTNAKSEDIKVNIVNENIFFKLKDGKYVYEIIATWNSNEKFSGTVRYSFCTNKANFNLDSYPKIGVNSKIKSTYNQTAEVKLPLIRLHDLRHTSATLLLANKVDIETVANRLGHSQVSTTLDIYGHALKEMDIKASNVLTNIFK